MDGIERKRKKSEIDDLDGGGRRMKKEATTTTPPPTEEEVDEFFTILNRMRATVKYFKNNKSTNTNKVAQTPKRGYVAIEILSDTVEAAKKPSVVAIDGLALGGGLEIAMEPSNSEDVFPVAGASLRVDAIANTSNDTCAAQKKVLDTATTLVISITVRVAYQIEVSEVGKVKVQYNVLGLQVYQARTATKLKCVAWLFSI